MRHLNRSSLVPVASFVLAVGLSMLGGGPIRTVLARQVAGVTGCTGSATATSITVAAGSGIKKGVAGWTFAILDQPVTVVNSKTAGMMVGDFLDIDVDDVVATDTKNVRRPLGTLYLRVPYTPFPTYDNQNLPPPGSNVNAIPASVTLAAIQANLKSTVVKLLPTVTVKKITMTLNAQTTSTHQVITIICSDGTELPATPRPDTALPVDNKGNGNAVKN
jgi:hypothetical protein